MLRTVIWSCAVLMLAAGGLAPATAHAAPHDVQHLASVDDFEFASFDADYYLDRDDHGQSMLRTVETLVAEFPDIDQNRGIRRSIPERYLGRPTDLVIVSVTDGEGNPLSYETDSDDDVLSITIAADDYVHGTRIYVIEYEQRNVTEFFSNTGRDEFYWDVNGLDWAQPFERVTATVHLPAELHERLTGHVSAVQGGDGSRQPATAQPATTDGLVFASDGPLGPHQTLSFSIGFAPGTFAVRDSGFFAAPAPLISAIAAVVALGTAVAAAVVRRRHLRDAPGRGIIVPEYEPLSGVNVLTAANIYGSVTRAIPAQLVDLAIRGSVRLLEAQGEKRGKRGYRIELLDATDIDVHEYKAVQAVFGYDPVPGAIRDLSTRDGTTASGFEKLQQQISVDVLANGLRKPYPAKLVTVLLIVASIAALTGAISGGVSLDQVYGGAWPGVSLAVSFAGLVAAIVLISRRPLTARGVEIRDHLRGLKMYIKLAEADRLRYLQSPEGADRAPLSGVADPEGEEMRLVHLHERLLPYAMLFGLEKRWAAVLARLYETNDVPPSWYIAPLAFNAGNFSSSFGAFSSSLGGAYGASSSGGSSGASAGGGGGGGGGGGV
ncbi:MAG: DUF2207 domain-containing protein [Microbacteriaceae bacterium]|nr:DUF2207 domain-containing protein [Microbacteriaceae bacterium]